MSRRMSRKTQPERQEIQLAQPEEEEQEDEDTLPLQPEASGLPLQPVGGGVPLQPVKQEPQRQPVDTDSVRSTETEASKASSLAKRQAQKSWANAVRGTKFRRQFEHLCEADQAVFKTNWMIEKEKAVLQAEECHARSQTESVLTGGVYITKSQIATRENLSLEDPQLHELLIGLERPSEKERKPEPHRRSKTHSEPNGKKELYKTYKGCAEFIKMRREGKSFCSSVFTWISEEGKNKTHRRDSKTETKLFKR
eukprot:6490684-Amphidinium_carterae.1